MFDTYAGGLWPCDTDDRDRRAVADHRCAVAPVPGGLNRLMRTVRAVRVEPAPLPQSRRDSAPAIRHPATTRPSASHW